MGRPDDVPRRPADEGGRGVGLALMGTCRILISESIITALRKEILSCVLSVHNHIFILYYMALKSFDE